MNQLAWYQRINPFRGLKNAREVWSWGMYDLANQSFTLLVVTLFFSVYFQNIIASTKADGQRLWGISIAVASLVVVLLGPLAGALADFSGQKKRWLLSMAIGCSALTCLLALTGPGTVILAMALFIPANVMYMLGENFLAAFLPEIADRDEIGKVSTIGFAMGYAGALLVLPIGGLLLIFSGHDANGQPVALGFQLILLFSGLWFFLNSIPSMFLLRERKQSETLPPGQTLWSIGFLRLGNTIRHARQFRQLLQFLVVFMIYSCGVISIIVFSGDLAFQYLGAGPVFLGYIFALSAIAVCGTIATGFLLRYAGYRITIAAALVIWLITAIGAALLPPPGPDAPLWPIWCVGAGVGIGLGMIGNASRALVGTFTPNYKTAEFFGLWGLAYKMAGVIGPPVYGFLAATGTAASTAGGSNTAAAMAAVAGSFLVGLIGLFLVDINAGQQAAEDAQREYDRQLPPAMPANISASAES